MGVIVIFSEIRRNGYCNPQFPVDHRKIKTNNEVDSKRKLKRIKIPNNFSIFAQKEPNSVANCLNLRALATCCPT